MSSLTTPDAARLFLLKAQQDEAAQHRLASDPGIADSSIGFHAQQAVEKLLKAALILTGAPLPRTHDIRRLSQLVLEAGLTPPVPGPALATLTAFAVEFFHGAAPVEEPPLDRDTACAHVAMLRTWVDGLCAEADTRRLG